MKKEFLIPEVEVIELEGCDVITASDCPPVNIAGCEGNDCDEDLS